MKTSVFIRVRATCFMGKKTLDYRKDQGPDAFSSNVTDLRILSADSANSVEH